MFVVVNVCLIFVCFYVVQAAQATGSRFNYSETLWLL